VAQLGARFHGMEEVVGSIPTRSTILTSQLGANAVVGIRYDATEVMQGVTEVLCYGTAVLVEPVRSN
jgi:hypothetical protein